MNAKLKSALTLGAVLSLSLTIINTQVSHASVGAKIGGAIGTLGGAALGGIYDFGDLAQNNSVAATGSLVGMAVGAAAGARTQSLPLNIYHGIENSLKSWAFIIFK